LSAFATATSRTSAASCGTLRADAHRGDYRIVENEPLAVAATVSVGQPPSANKTMLQTVGAFAPYTSIVEVVAYYAFSFSCKLGEDLTDWLNTKTNLTFGYFFIFA
jgi:hypothetical protein